MGVLSAHLGYLFESWVVVTALLAILVIYGNTLSAREDDQLYLNKAEEIMMGSVQQALIRKMDRLKRVITIFAVFSGTLLLTSYIVWVWRVLEET